MGTPSRVARLAGLAAISPVGALIGGLVDERVHLGFTNWRSACRASGLSFASLFKFTLELLPNAIVGALLGGLLVQLLAFSLRPRHTEACLAAHLGCAVVMPLGLLLCALALPIPLMLITEVALAVAAAYLMQALWKRHSATRIPLYP
jgi:hypothetical protein